MANFKNHGSLNNHASYVTSTATIVIKRNNSYKNGLISELQLQSAEFLIFSDLNLS